MALTLIEPNLLNFARNPIVFRATTDKHLVAEESMLRIACSMEFGVTGSPDRTYATELSQPVENGGTASFNLSDPSQTLIQRMLAELDMSSSSAFGHVGLYGTATFRELWIMDGAEVRGEVVTSRRFYVVPGGFTDFELLSRGGIDLLGITAGGKRMSRKPDGGILYRGETLIVPTLMGIDPTNGDAEVKESIFSLRVEEYNYGSGSTMAKLVSQGTTGITGNAVDYHRAATSAGDFDGQFVFSSSTTDDVVGHFCTNTYGVHFLRFVNGFGAVENIAVRAKDKLSYPVSGETHSLVQGISTRPTDRRYATKSQPVGVYELSSGYVPKQWAEWYVQELLTSPKVWIQLGGQWVPALIEAEDDCVIYDRTKPGMPHVDFTLRLAIDGVTGITW